MLLGFPRAGMWWGGAGWGSLGRPRDLTIYCEKPCWNSAPLQMFMYQEFLQFSSLGYHATLRVLASCPLTPVPHHSPLPCCILSTLYVCKCGYLVFGSNVYFSTTNLINFGHWHLLHPHGMEYQQEFSFLCLFFSGMCHQGLYIET